MKLVQLYAAQNDTNGNPRRVYVLFQALGGMVSPVAVEDCGYVGMPKGWGKHAQLPTVSVSPSDYRDWLKVLS